MNALVYDIEISTTIDKPSDWRDFERMGIACVGCYDYVEDRYRVFCGDNLYAIAELFEKRDLIIGFNNISFDNKLMGAKGFCDEMGIEYLSPKSYDLLVEVWRAAGQPLTYTRGRTRPGYSLDRIAQATIGVGKQGSGSDAPILWQNGERGAVIDYCLSDVWLTKRLFDMRDRIIDPTNGQTLKLREP